MKIDRDEALRVARLARLEFDDAALLRIAADMTEILEYIDQLRAVDLHAIAADAAQRVTPMRDDAAHASLPREGVAANAPSWDDGFFVVPPVIGSES